MTRTSKKSYILKQNLDIVNPAELLIQNIPIVTFNQNSQQEKTFREKLLPSTKFNSKRKQNVWGRLLKQN